MSAGKAKKCRSHSNDFPVHATSRTGESNIGRGHSIIRGEQPKVGVEQAKIHAAQPEIHTRSRRS
jgi:hypothetical protein